MTRCHLNASLPNIPDNGLIDHDGPFSVYLPVNEAMDDNGATHVATMRGDEATFPDVLAESIATGSYASAPLRTTVADTSIEKIAEALRGLGPAVVESIDPL